MRNMWIIATLALAIGATAQEPIEVTRQDFTRAKTVRSLSLHSFGISLGDSPEQFQRAASAAHLIAESDSIRGCCSVHDERGDEILAVNFTDGHITRIAWFHGMQRYLAGESARLLDDRITDPESPLRLQLLGREDSHTSERNSLGVTVSYSYDKEGIRIIRASYASPVVHLVASAKTR